MREALLVSIVGYHRAMRVKTEAGSAILRREGGVSSLFNRLFTEGSQEVVAKLPADFRDKNFLTKKNGHA